MDELLVTVIPVPQDLDIKAAFTCNVAKRENVNEKLRGASMRW
jgi:hypothetical protein